MRLLLLSVLAALIASLPARADRGAFSVDAGAGATVTRVPAPYSDGGASQVGSAPTIWLDGRYALTNWIELTGTAFFETTVPYYVTGTTITSDAGTVSGTLEMRTRRYGMMAGARFIRGNIWRLIAGADVGWALTSYTGVRLIDATNPSGPRDFGLALPDTTANALILAPSLGVSWVGDKLSVTVLPRFQALLGSTRSWAVTVPLTVGWDWYL